MVAFLDANIFPHTWLTDVLLTFAVHHLFDLEYSDDVLEEARRAFVDDLGKDSAWVDRYLSAIRNVKPYYFVSPIPELTGEVVLPDADDRHVAAAYNGDADVIVTFNLKDFPANQLAKIGLSARHPRRVSDRRRRGISRTRGQGHDRTGRIEKASAAHHAGKNWNGSNIPACRDSPV
ncbi:PIN domain-containing protein [Bifidobacterium stellenboschense]|uniref:PIN domain-containing protein n=1 Tax=Bifidobacterium stellenboschense TaxID=762211 RepID=UPI00138E2870|nr:PIN domain-containing protein [Bifidobacterium stellenboschense]